eukprot:758224-Hanusia_phi.AAC.2
MIIELNCTVRNLFFNHGLNLCRSLRRLARRAAGARAMMGSAGPARIGAATHHRRARERPGPVTRQSLGSGPGPSPDPMPSDPGGRGESRVKGFKCNLTWTHCQESSNCRTIKLSTKVLIPDKMNMIHAARSGWSEQGGREKERKGGDTRAWTHLECRDEEIDLALVAQNAHQFQPFNISFASFSVYCVLEEMAG